MVQHIFKCPQVRYNAFKCIYMLNTYMAFYLQSVIKIKWNFQWHRLLRFSLMISQLIFITIAAIHRRHISICLCILPLKSQRCRVLMETAGKRSKFKKFRYFHVSIRRIIIIICRRETLEFKIIK